MKVRCKKLLNSAGAPEDTSLWLTVGSEYHVLSVIYDSGRCLLRLYGDEPNGVALFPFGMFEVTSSKLPSSWIISPENDNYFELTPKAWAKARFWDLYYDGEPEEERVFTYEMKKMIAEDA